MSTSWTDAEYDAVERIANMPLDEENVDVILDSFTSLPGDVLLEIVVKSRWTVQQVTRLCRVSRRWNERFCGGGSVAIWLGLLLRDFNVSAAPGSMRARTEGAAVSVANSMRQHVLGGEGGDAGVAERARYLYRSLYSFVFNNERLPFAAEDDEAEFADAVVETLGKQLRVRESRDPSPELYLEMIAQSELHRFVYDNGFIIVKPCLTGAATSLYLLTDVVQYVFNKQLVRDVVLAGQFARGPQDMRFRRGDLVFPRFDTAGSRHAPLVIDGGGAEWRVWPRVTEPGSDESGPESIPVDGFAFDLQAIAGGQSPFLFWSTKGARDESGARLLQLSSVQGQPTAQFPLSMPNVADQQFRQFLSLTDTHALLLFETRLASVLVLAKLEPETYRPVQSINVPMPNMQPDVGGIWIETPERVVTFTAQHAQNEVVLRLHYFDAQQFQYETHTLVTWEQSNGELQIIVAGNYLVIPFASLDAPVVIRIDDDHKAATAISYPVSFVTYPRYERLLMKREPRPAEAKHVAAVALGRNHFHRVKCTRNFRGQEDYDAAKDRGKRQRVRHKFK